jgi:branched-chain amino acid transport system substrate-binding protein
MDRHAAKARLAMIVPTPCRLVLLAMSLALPLIVAQPVSAQMSRSVIKIGVLGDMSSSYQDVGGKGSVVAAQLAAEEFGDTVAGAKIEVVSADAQNKPDLASAIARRWYDEEGVDIILDLPASNVALAVQQLAKERHKISVTTGGGTTDLTGKNCSPTGFHWVWDTYSMAHGAGQAIVQAGGKSWFFVTGDFAAGVTLEREATEAVLASGGKVVGSVRVPFPNTDFASQLVLAQQSGAQVIGIADAGDDAVNIIKQAAEFGVTPTQTMAGLITYISEIHSLGLQTAAGMQFVTGFYWDANDASRTWSRKFAARMGGHFPTMSQAGVYSAARHYLQAVKDTGTDDDVKVVQAMRATPINDALATNGHLREDGSMVHDMMLIQVKSPAESKYPWDYYKILKTIPGDEAFMPLDKVACPLLHK